MKESIRWPRNTKVCLFDFFSWLFWQNGRSVFFETLPNLINPLTWPPDLAQSENKLNAEFAVLGGHENEHPGIAAYLKAYGEASNAIAENHFIYVRP
jgi:hypothetical protein